MNLIMPYSPYSNLADIQAMLGVVSESNELEFKRGDLLESFDQSKTRDELVRDVSAFANAGGGTIIYGIEEDKDGRALSIWPVKNEKVDDLRLTQIIRTGLEPVFNRFNVHHFDLPDSGRIFVISVEKADTAHQCKSDQKYYHRVGLHRPAMYDYEIRDVMNRRTAPIVHLSYQLAKIEGSRTRHKYRFVPTIVNEGHLTVRHWALELVIPECGGNETQSAHVIAEKARLANFPRHRVFEFTSERTPSNRRALLLPAQSLTLHEATGYSQMYLEVTSDSYQQLVKNSPPILLRLYVDDCAMKEVVIPFKDWCDF